VRAAPPRPVSDEHVVDHRPLARSLPWGGRGGEVDQGSKGAKGEVGTAIVVPRKWVSFFDPTPPALAAATISKDASKAAAPPRLTALVSPFRTTKTLTE
jgi:hypothetical protein